MGHFGTKWDKGSPNDMFLHNHRGCKQTANINIDGIAFGFADKHSDVENGVT
jgi:hypothetical protein